MSLVEWANIFMGLESHVYEMSASGSLNPTWESSLNVVKKVQKSFGIVS